MRLRLFQRRNLPCPTIWCWLLFLALAGAPLLAWWYRGEIFLSLNERLPADVLIVEAWTDAEGAEAAAAEFKGSGMPYQFVVAAGGLTGNPWTKRRWSYPEIAEAELTQAAIPSSRIILARSEDNGSHRTFETAVAAKQALDARGIHPKIVNVFTRGAHARRSRLVFAKVFGPDIRVGVICWIPPGYSRGPWWQSSDRANDLLKETVGYLYEALLNSGRHRPNPNPASTGIHPAGPAMQGTNPTNS